MIIFVVTCVFCISAHPCSVNVNTICHTNVILVLTNNITHSSMVSVIVTHCGNGSPCMNGGTCIDNKFCVCSEDYTGERCNRGEAI